LRGSNNLRRALQCASPLAKPSAFSLIVERAAGVFFQRSVIDRAHTQELTFPFVNSDRQSCVGILLAAPVRIRISLELFALACRTNSPKRKTKRENEKEKTVAKQKKNKKKFKPQKTMK
jgi:hypothetical protein